MLVLTAPTVWISKNIPRLTRTKMTKTLLLILGVLSPKILFQTLTRWPIGSNPWSSFQKRSHQSSIRQHPQSGRKVYRIRLAGLKTYQIHTAAKNWKLKTRRLLNRPYSRLHSSLWHSFLHHFFLSRCHWLSHKSSRKHNHNRKQKHSHKLK